MRKLRGHIYVSAAAVTVALGLGAVWSGAFAGEPVGSVTAEPVKTLASRVNEHLRLLDSTVAHVDLPGAVQVPFRALVPIEGQMMTLDLVPNSVRAANFKALAQIADGSLVEVDPGPSRTYRGTVVEVEGSVVAGSLLDDGLHARIVLPSGEEYWMEPIASIVPGALRGQHAIYRIVTQGQ